VVCRDDDIRIVKLIFQAPPVLSVVLGCFQGVLGVATKMSIEVSGSLSV
jgi:hypothetical protein